MEGQAILALMAVLCLGMVTGSLITAGICALVIRHAASPPTGAPTIGVPSDALAQLAQLDAKFKNFVPLIEQFAAAVAAVNASAAGKK